MPPPAYARRCRCTGEAITAQEVCFQIVDWHAEDAEVADTDDDGDGPAYTVKAFGVLRDGRSIGVTLTRFTPYFYIKASDLTGGPPMSPPACSRLEAWLTARLKSPAALHSTTLVLRKDFMGFTNYQEEQFLRLCFRTLASFRLAARILGADGGVAIPPLFRGARKLRLYESNVEPLLRLLHTRGLRPCGWARLPARSYVATATLLPSACQVDVQAKWTRIEPMDTDELAPMVVMSYDIECSSSDGSFPQPAKTYVKTAHELYDWYHTQLGSSAFCASDNTAAGVHLAETLAQAFDPRVGAGRVSKLTAKSGADVGRVLDRLLCPRGQHVPMLADIVRGRLEYDECLGRWQQARTKLPKDAVVTHLERKLRSVLPPLEGDRVIQVGVTAHIYGERHVTHRHILTLGTCDAVGDDTVVESFEAEAPLLLRWALLVAELDPDIVVGYNTFGFDDNFLIMRARELGIERDFLAPLGRLRSGCAARYVERMLSSSALGDNSLRYILMPGRVAVDMMKLVQRDHKLDSYKLDAVAQHFTGQKKHDVTPAEIFRLQDGDAVDRAVIARYCVQDCALCNDLAIRLEVVPNAAAMANVCWVPLSWIFLRGQGVKVYSLVARTARLEGFVIPSRDRASYEVQDAGYEGALVLDPREGVYTDPVAVCDYSSLYPSCMISENLSHDCIVLDSRYAHLPNVAYNEVEYEQADGTLQRCRFAHARKGVLPSILEELIRQRQMARQRMACTSDPFLRAVLDGLQLAYKITANSLYGQMGAVTSPLYLRDIAACTTATGRKMILAAKAYMESEHAAQVIYGDSVPGYTPCVVRMSDGRVAVRRIEAIAGDGHWHPCDGGKEACEVWDMEAWTERGWTRIDRIIRHRLASHKRLLRVVTAAGIVDATDDHSLLRSSGHPVSPAAVRPGDTLLQAPYPLIPHVPGWRPDCSVAEQVAVARAQGFAFAGGDQRMYGAASLQDVPDSVPDNVLQASEAVRKAFLLGVHDAACALGSGHPTGGVSVRCSSQLGAQTLAMLASTLRRRTVFTPGPGSAVDVRLLPCRVGDSLDSSDSSSHTNDRSHTSSDSSDSNNVVQEVIVLTTGQGDFVYDLTTANHHFQAGVGSLVVHNTGVPIVFPAPALRLGRLRTRPVNTLPPSNICRLHLLRVPQHRRLRKAAGGH